MIELIQRFIKESANLRVCVIGETIVDRFIPVTYEGPSMKSACPVYRLRGKAANQEGGAGAIANHLREFVKSIDLLTNPQDAVIKTRYIDADTGQKHVEINHFDRDRFPSFKVDVNDYDVVIVADFGHGLCDKLEINHGFHLMCQTNSNNFGFNRASKWKHQSKASVSIDLREGSLQTNQRIDPMNEEQVHQLYNYELNTRDMYLTLGAQGSLLCNGKDIHRQKVFPSQIVDTIGAGDAFFAFASVCSALAFSPEKQMEIPALAASLSTTWLCNEFAVTPDKLLTYATRFVQESVPATP